MSADIIGTICADSSTVAGKRDCNIRTWENIQFRYLGYTPAYDIDQMMLPFDQWDKSVLGWYLEMHTADDFHLEYLPIMDEATPLYGMFMIRDAQNNQHSSGLIPLT